jgi:hypothetical protein
MSAAGERSFAMKMFGRGLLGVVGVGVLALVPVTVEAQRVKEAPAVAAQATAPEVDPVMVQQGLIKLVRLSPTLVEVLERDPSLLADEAYVGRVNPELEQYVVAHPEVTRNPDFYLFTVLDRQHNRQYDVLQRKVWPNEDGPRREETQGELAMRFILPYVVFVCVLVAALWLIYVLLQNRRWTRASRLQMEAHSKLMDRFGSNQELLAYMQSEAGRRFLEAAPIPVDMEAGQRLPNVVSRVLLSLQVGIVLGLLGIGLLSLRRVLPDQSAALLVAGVVFLVPGLGFVVSAVITWVLAGKLGLMPGADSGSRQ